MDKGGRGGGGGRSGFGGMGRAGAGIEGPGKSKYGFGRESGFGDEKSSSGGAMNRGGKGSSESRTEFNKYNRGGSSSKAGKESRTHFNMGTKSLRAKDMKPGEKLRGQDAISSKAAGTKVTSENYQQVYKQKQQEILEERLAKEKKAASASAKSYQKQQEENTTRSRARYLKDQVNMWKQRKGVAGYDDSMIDANVTNLERELYQIKSIYRN